MQLLEAGSWKAFTTLVMVAAILFVSSTRMTTNAVQAVHL